MKRTVEIKYPDHGCTLTVTIDVYGDRRTRPNGWWEEAKIESGDDMSGLLREFSGLDKWAAYDDLMEAGTFKEARSRGTVRLEGKTYEVKDGDIITFRFNV